MEFLLLKLIHVASAIVAVGANVTYTFWLARAHRDRVHLVFVIETIRALDRRIAIPAYVLLFASGVLMVLTGAYSFTTGWIAAAIGLYVLTFALGITAFGPTVRRQLAEARRDPSSLAYADLSRADQRLTLVTLGLVGAIVVLMVTKPF